MPWLSSRMQATTGQEKCHNICYQKCFWTIFFLFKLEQQVKQMLRPGTDKLIAGRHTLPLVDRLTRSKIQRETFGTVQPAQVTGLTLCIRFCSLGCHVNENFWDCRTHCRISHNSKKLTHHSGTLGLHPVWYGILELNVPLDTVWYGIIEFNVPLDTV